MSSTVEFVSETGDTIYIKYIHKEEYIVSLKVNDDDEIFMDRDSLDAFHVVLGKFLTGGQQTLVPEL